MIILRIGLGMSIDDTVVSSHFVAVSKSRDRQVSVPMPMKTLSIHVTETTDMQQDARRSSVELGEDKSRYNSVDVSSTKVPSLTDDIEEHPLT